MPEKVQVGLSGVPETLLWTLYQRAGEAARPDAVIADPKAVELVERIDYPFAERFGSGAGFGQWQALRARCFDREVRRFLTRRPDGAVVALGEGLETQFWRTDNGRVDWLGVDLPETVAVRERLLGTAPRRRTLAGSALDDGWMDAVDPDRGVLISAQGLLMYFAPAEVHELIAACGRRFPGATLVFDAVPAWLARRGRQRPPEGGRYAPPPWTWAVDAAEERRLAILVDELTPLRVPRGRGPLHGFALPLAARIAPLRRALLTVFRATLAQR